MPISAQIDFCGIKGQEHHPTIRAVTPTMNRPQFLEGQYKQFVEMSMRYPGKTEWVVVDVSPTPCAFLSDLNDKRVHYLHLASRKRADINELYAEYPELKGCVTESAEEALIAYNELVKLKASDPAKYPPRVTPLTDWSIMSLGEQRNISLKLNTGNNRPDIFVQLDDDDYYHPEYFNWAEERMRSADLLRQGDLFQYIGDSNIWAKYEFDSDNPTRKIRTNGELIELIQPEDVRKLRAEGKISRDGFGFGLGFVYSGKMVDSIFSKGENPFPSISLYEDGFFAAKLETMGARLDFPKGDNPMICRILHSRQVGHGQANISIDTRIHQILEENHVRAEFPEMYAGVHRMVSRNKGRDQTIEASPQSMIHGQISLDCR